MIAWAYIPADAETVRDEVISHLVDLAALAKESFLYFLTALVVLLLLKKFAKAAL